MLEANITSTFTSTYRFTTITTTNRMAYNCGRRTTGNDDNEDIAFVGSISTNIDLSLSTPSLGLR